MLFDLYGDFAVEGQRSAQVRLSALVQLAETLGVNEPAVRSAAVRLAHEGWLQAERQGRESIYQLSPRGRRLVEEGRARIFRPLGAAWDGTWCIVVSAVPEAHRDVRDRLRKELAFLGFGSPSHGVFVAPRDYRAEVQRLVRDLGAEEWVQLYRAEAAWPGEPAELVRRAWSDLAERNRQYSAFLDEFAPRFALDRVRAEGDRLPADEAFRTRFHLASGFRHRLFGDPDLPTELLPARWSGLAANRLFLEYHELLGPAALAYFDRVAG